MYDTGMLTQYIQAAMRSAGYELLEDKNFYGEIPGLQGVYANAGSLEECRSELQSALEDWIVFSLRNGFEIPPVQGITLQAAEIA
jgi:predicted RNase H-like HicB family nuclease